MDYIFEVVLLAFIIWVWYSAKRDLSATAAARQSPAAQELKELRETVEQLIDVLEVRATAAEKRLQAVIQNAEKVERSIAASMAAQEVTTDYAVRLDETGDTTGREAEFIPEAAAQPLPIRVSAASDRYSPVYELADSGIDDISEIARQTGFGQAEVSLVLSLRPRNIDN